VPDITYSIDNIVHAPDCIYPIVQELMKTDGKEM
jgi:hypothetical protein